MNKTLSLECSSAQRLFSVAELISGMGSMCVASAVHILIVVIEGTGGELVSLLKSCQLLIFVSNLSMFHLCCSTRECSLFPGNSCIYLCIMCLDCS